MARIGLFYGSTDGHTAAVAQLIKEKLDAVLGAREGEAVELFDVAEYFLAEMARFDYLILGVPTWNVGQLQGDWEAVLDEFDSLDLTGKRIALYGLGDQVGYPDTFADAMFFVADRVRTAGGELVGVWPANGYHFDSSWAYEDGHFVGLVLDEHNQFELTLPRLDAWLTQLRHEFGLD